MAINIYYSSSIGQQDLEVIEIGTQRCDPGYQVGPSVRDFYILHYIHSGQGMLETDGQEYPVREGQLFLVFPHRIAKYAANRAHPWQYSWIGFQGCLAERLLAEAGFSFRHPVVDGRQERIDTLFRHLWPAQLQAKGTESILTGSLYSLLGELAALNAEAGNGDAVQDSELYTTRAAAFITTHYASKIGLNDIARHVGLDSKYLCRLFNLHLQTSPYRYLMDVRMHNACRLMKHPELSISDISRSVGYQDPLLFSRMFKKAKGMSPAAYRKTIDRQQA
ncbi:AraC family transcriptional regulator [Paenibacillus montanisoli]|uniref:AraC family transcriptional regulator n=1 Tax=Paenibacillus montanisoli TaxID=2081970 RepID=A0A328TZ79_9BACL|nr:AraC family transcriptional regulator [Paenibacillus montanisoli]RAP74441.1 AraC family transcriptional regulator [Paenibacillus montanisoli]